MAAAITTSSLFNVARYNFLTQGYSGSFAATGTHIWAYLVLENDNKGTSVPTGAADWTALITHSTENDITDGAIAQSSGADAIAELSGKTVLATGTGTTSSAGAFDAADTTFSVVDNNEWSNCVVLMDGNATGVTTSSELIALLFFTSVVGNGGSITLQWSAGDNRILRL